MVVVEGADGGGGYARAGIVKLEQDGNKEDGYSGPTLTHTGPGLNYTCVSGGSVQMWKGSHSSSTKPPRPTPNHPPRAGGKAGVRVGWGWNREGVLRSPGTGTHYMHDGCERRPPRAHPHTHKNAHTRARSPLPGSIRHSAMMGGHLSPRVAGACLAGEARKAMALFSCKKLKNLPSVQ